MSYTELSFRPKGVDGRAEFPNLAASIANPASGAEDATKLPGGYWMNVFEPVWNP